MKSDNNMARPFLIVDGSNYVYRAYHAILGLTNSRGFPTNAIYGFTNMLLKTLRQWEPERVAVVFDLKGATFRHRVFPDYKANRPATPDDLVVQIPKIKEILRALAIPVVEIEGVEADDIIGTLARRAEGEGIPVILASGDKDMMQLVSPGVTMVDSLKEKIYDEAAVRERFGVEPRQVPEVLGLMGDRSDNIPGVPGIGPKTAQRLIEEFGSVAALVAGVERVKSQGQRRLIADHAAQALLSLDLVTIRTDIPLELSLEECRKGEPDRNILVKLLMELEFTSLLNEFRIKEKNLEGEYRALTGGEDSETLFAAIRERAEVTLEVLAEGSPTQGRLHGIAFGVAPGQAYYLALDDEGPPGSAAARAASWRQLAAVIENPQIAKCGHDLKTAAVFLAAAGLEPAGFAFDTMLAAYLLNPTRRNFDLDDLARDCLSRKIPSREEFLGAGAKVVSLGRIGWQERRDYACRRADAAMALVPLLKAKLDERGQGALFTEMEMPLVAVLARMEAKGVLLDVESLRLISRELEERMAAVEQKIHQLAGERFNINSPKQLQTILFDKLQLTRGKKIKEGYSTDSDVLAGLARQHELPAAVLEWRSMTKLKGTYLDALPLLIKPATGRLHTSYNQAVTATGRLSSSNPNLQNIPIRTEEGRRIRQAFVAPGGHFIMAADYSQIELRVLAHLSQDETLRRTFAAGEDIHQRTAAEVFRVLPELVSADMRRQAKVINFGILYGMGAFSLSRELGVSQKVAQAYIDGYFARYPGVKAYLESVLARAREKGYVSTLFQRIRYIPEINSANAPVRQFAERTAINTPIQGTAADLIKLAMVKIDARLRENRMKAAMIMQVHDELVFEAPEEEREELIALARTEMEGAVALSVPLKVDIGAGGTWDEAHG